MMSGRVYLQSSERYVVFTLVCRLDVGALLKPYSGCYALADSGERFLQIAGIGTVFSNGLRDGQG